MKLKSFFCTAPWLVLLSCTIIEEDDLITEEDFEKIRLTRIELVQDANNVRTSATMMVGWDSVISKPGPQGTVTRSLGLELTGFQGRKLKFRSGEASSLTLKATFYSNGHPFRFDIIRNNTIVERYVFRYNEDDRLARLAFFLGFDNLMTSDTIVYDDAGQIDYIGREEFVPAPSGNIDVEYDLGGQKAFISRFVTSAYRFEMNPGSCSFNAQKDECFGINRFPNAGGGPGSFNNPQVNFNYTMDFEQLGSFTLREQRSQQSGGTTRNPDVYYFHPFMLLDGNLENGKDLLVIYMTDWYEPGEEVTGNIPSFDEMVTFEYIYGI